MNEPIVITAPVLIDSKDTLLKPSNFTIELHDRYLNYKYRCLFSTINEVTSLEEERKYDIEDCLKKSKITDVSFRYHNESQLYYIWVNGNDLCFAFENRQVAKTHFKVIKEWFLR